tara:strand:+ start:1332 stop:2477 length:1146 start_codon:yes stop_codon:yes gene_type:complete
VKNSRKKQSYSKKKILIISRHLIKKKNDYRWFFIYDSLKEFDFINISYDSYFNQNKQKNLINKISKILKNNKIDLFIDLIFPIDLNIINEKYKQNLKYIFEIRELIKKFNVKSLRFNYPLLGSWSLTPWVYLSYFKLFIKMIQNLLLKNYYKFPKSNFVCITGEQGKFEIYKFGVKKLYFPHFDYLIYKKAKKKLSTNKNYFLYLDQNIQHSHDRKLVNFESNFSNFEKEINKFLMILKKKYNTEIIIASHPKRDLNKQTILTKNWKIIKGDTAKLVYNSDLVIAHDTMSVNYAVLMLKPLIFISTNQLEKSFYSKTISNYSKYFYKRKINVSEINEKDLELSKSKLFSLNKHRYGQYKNNLIISLKNKDLKFSKIIKKII